MNNIVKRVYDHFFNQSDIYIISHPKTGRTWLRVLIGKSISEIYNLSEERLLDTRFMTSKAKLPRTTISHEESAMSLNIPYYEITSDKDFYSKKKIILLSRNIKDTLVSAYFQATRRKKIFNGSISDFIRDPNYGAIKFITFYNIWYQNRNLPIDLLFLRYEDLHENPAKVLYNVLSFLEIQTIDDFTIENAVTYSSFKNLKKAEREDKFNSGVLQPGNIEDEESYKVRKGKVGNYTENLSSEDINFIDELNKSLGCAYTK